MQVTFYDIETTGLDVFNDRIVEIFAIRLDTKLNPISDTLKLAGTFHSLVNPTIPIPARTTALHGITDEMVKNSPTFAQIAPHLDPLFSGCALGGWNIAGYDNLLLSVEFERVGINFDFENRPIIDGKKIYDYIEPHTLIGAHKRFLGTEMESAHSASHDVMASVAVTKEMMNIYNLPSKFTDLSNLIKKDYALDYNGKLVVENGHVVVKFGDKHNGKTFEEVYQTDKDFIRWVINDSNLPSAIKFYFKRFANKLREGKPLLG